MNLPNKLTMLRVFLIPVYVVFMLLIPKFDWMRYLALFVFIVASLTDLFDGKIARKYNLVTNFGKFMDPLADKLLVCTGLILFVQLGVFSEGHSLFNPGIENVIYTIVVLLIVAREFIISGFRLIAAEKGVVLAAVKIAKLKTTFQMIMLITLMFNLPKFFELILKNDVMTVPCVILEWILILISLVLTVVSLMSYLTKNWYVMKDQK